MGHGSQVRTNSENDQGGQVDLAPAVDIREPAHEGHRDAVSQQIAGDDPGRVVHPGLEWDLKVNYPRVTIDFTNTYLESIWIA